MVLSPCVRASEGRRKRSDQAPFTASTLGHERLTRNTRDRLGRPRLDLTPVSLYLYVTHTCLNYLRVSSGSGRWCSNSHCAR
jgi:hypothetical protein